MDVSYLTYHVEQEGDRWVASVVEGTGWLQHVRGRADDPVTALHDLLLALSAVLGDG